MRRRGGGREGEGGRGEEGAEVGLGGGGEEEGKGAGWVRSRRER